MFGLGVGVGYNRVGVGVRIIEIHNILVIQLMLNHKAHKNKNSHT